MPPISTNHFISQRGEAFSDIPPGSSSTLAPEISLGMKILVTICYVSLATLICVLGNIGYHIRRVWKHFMRNPPLISVTNLFIADIVQNVGFAITTRWIKLDRIISPSTACFVQGYLINLGDVTSGSFVLVIAVITALNIYRGTPIEYRQMVVTAICTWAFGIILSSVGPAVDNSGLSFYVQAGNWCWINEEYEDARLGFHYLLVFFVEACVLIIYPSLFVYLQVKIRYIRRNARPGEEEQTELTLHGLQRAFSFLIVYPTVYIVTSLPLAASRMRIMSGHKVSQEALIVAGCLYVSSGWIDAIVYTFSRTLWRQSDTLPVERPVSDAVVATVQPIQIPETPTPSPRRSSGWFNYPGLRNINTGTARPAFPEGASPSYTSRRPQVWNAEQSSHEQLLGAHELGTSDGLAIPLTELNTVATPREKVTPGLAVSPGLHHPINYATGDETTHENQENTLSVPSNENSGPNSLYEESGCPPAAKSAADQV